MNNQLLHWLMFFLPWLTLFFMKKNEIKRYMPVAWLSALTSVIITELGITFQWWSVVESAYPLKHVLPNLIGLFPVVTIWIFRFTFGKFWLYLAVEIVFNLGFNFLFLSMFLPAMGILQMNQNPFLGTLLTTSHGLLLYLYQLWQDSAFADGIKR